MLTASLIAARSTTTGTPITGATSDNYTPPTFNTIGTFYYYCVVSLSGNGCNDDTSDAAEVIVIDVPTATFTTVNSICFEDPNPILISTNLVLG